MIANVAVIFGGRSCEHEISILSAIQVMNALSQKYHVIPIYLDKEGNLYSDRSLIELETFQNNEMNKKSFKITFTRNNAELYIIHRRLLNKKERIDFVFPAMHGMHGEDGSIQGYLEILNIPYAGCDVLASSICMSKVRSKQLLKYFKIPTLDFNIIDDYHKENEIYPCIIKPDCLGSSIGIQIVHDEKDYIECAEKALLFDTQCLIEPYIEQFQEVNCSVRMLNNKIVLSALELVNKNDEILSFLDKYQSNSKGNGNDRILHPILEIEIENEVKEIACEVYRKFQLDGIIRIDFMIVNHKVYVNEINTIPGSYAFYLWDEEDFLVLLESVMDESMRHYQKKECKITSFKSDVLFQYNGNKGK